MTSFEKLTVSLLMALGANTGVGDTGVGEAAVELDGHGGGMTLRPQDTKAY